MKVVPFLLHVYALTVRVDSFLMAKRPVQNRLTISPQGKNDALKSTDVFAYFDIEITGIQVGQLVFRLADPSPLPLHAKNFIELVKGSRRGIDPMAHYVGCEFDFSPATVEDGMGRYRWGHHVRGRGRNAIGRADQPINDPENQLKHTHSCFGGQYYGIKYDPEGMVEGDPGVLLTVAVTGPGHGSSKFSIVRVGESPMEWQERLLVNCGVIGNMDPSCLDVLHMMARQREGPPTIVAAGIL